MPVCPSGSRPLAVGAQDCASCGWTDPSTRAVDRTRAFEASGADTVHAVDYSSWTSEGAWFALALVALLALYGCGAATRARGTA